MASISRALKGLFGPFAYELIKSAIPIVAGIVTFYYLWDSIDSGSPSDLRVIFSDAAPAYKLATFIYALFCASIIVVMAATLIYLFDFINIIKAVQEKGETLIKSAFIIMLLAVAMIPIGLFMWKALVDITPNDVCTGRDVIYSFHYHDGFVLIIFALFVVVDSLTIFGLKRAISSAAATEPRRERLCEYREWALAQLWLIDIPVLMGALALSALIPMLSHSPSRLLDHQLISGPSAPGIPAGAPPLTNLVCNSDNSTFGVHEFIGNTYVAGVGSGTLAAQIFLSQLVFVMLGFFFRFKRIARS